MAVTETEWQNIFVWLLSPYIFISLTLLKKEESLRWSM